MLDGVLSSNRLLKKINSCCFTNFIIRKGVSGGISFNFAGNVTFAVDGVDNFSKIIGQVVYFFRNILNILVSNLNKGGYLTTLKSISYWKTGSILVENFKRSINSVSSYVFSRRSC